MLGFLIIIFASLISATLFHFINLKILIKTYLSIHIFFFYLQLFVFYIFNYHLDFIEPITGESQRVIGGNFELLFSSFIRPSGLFSEPGTYALFVAPLICIFTRYSITDARENRFWYLCVITLFLSFSLYGIIFGILIFGLKIFKKITLNQILILASLLITTSTYLQWRTSDVGEQGYLPEGSDFRLTFIEQAYVYFLDSMENFLFGANLFHELPGFTFDFAVNDVGLIVYLFHFSGFIGILIYEI